MGISPYLRALRSRIGHDLVLVPSVAVMVMDAARRLLLVRNAETGEWQTVGGAIDPGESPAEAAVREAREETGLEVRLVRLVGVYGGPSFVLRYPNGDLCDYVTCAFEARVAGGVEQADGEETSELGWFTAGEVRDLAVAPHTRLLAAEAFADDPLPRFPGAR